jgi:hypothetical protein
MPSAIRDVRSKLFTIFDAALAGTQVFDGPRPRSTAPKKYLVVGVNGIDEAEAGIRSTQVQSSLSGDWREEAGEIDCTAVAWDGGDDMTKIRADVESMVDICEAAVVADRTLGGILTLNHSLAETTRVDVREQRTDKGPFVECVFTISYATVLT